MRSRRFSTNFVLAIAALTLLATTAQADVTISSQPTQNMTCSGGVCAPTAKTAVLNVGDLETLLAAGNVTVTTQGFRNKQANNIVIAAALSWATPSSLKLDAFQSVTIDGSVAVNGLGGLAIVTDEGGTSGTFSVGMNSSVEFQNLSSSLTINGAGYSLVNSVATLAGAVAANPNGDYALASSYNASGDGTYSSSPIATAFAGVFEGLGNTISNLTISEPCCYTNTGLFDTLAAGGVIRDVGIINGTFTFVGPGFRVGLLAGGSLGTISNSYSSGTITNGAGGNFGGLVGENDGAVVASNSSATITIGSGGVGGGLVGYNSGSIDSSYATGALPGTSAGNGGLVGYANSSSAITNSYATGEVGGKFAGGLVAETLGTISNSYSIGATTGGMGGYLGGLIGYDQSNPGSLVDTYWDMTTSGIDNKTQGAGNIANDPGIKGKTTTQLQAHLPRGFDKKIWGEDPAINGGLPYLLANPPPS